MDSILRWQRLGRRRRLLLPTLGAQPSIFGTFAGAAAAASSSFNAVFRLLPSSPLAATGCCLVSAWPGSFYERVFPEASLDYVVSSSSLHFLSKVLIDSYRLAAECTALSIDRYTDDEII